MSAANSYWPLQDKSLESALNLGGSGGTRAAPLPANETKASSKSKSGSLRLLDGSQYFSLTNLDSGGSSKSQQISMSHQLLNELQSELVKKDELVAENSRLARTLTLRESTFSQQESQMKQVLTCTRQELDNANNLLVSRQKSLNDMEARVKSLESAFSHFFQNLPRSAKDYVEGYVSFGTTGETDYAKALQLLRKVIDESLTSSALKKETLDNLRNRIGQLEKEKAESQVTITDLTKRNRDVKAKEESACEQVRKLNADIRDLQSQQGSLSKLNESLLAQSQSLESLLQGKHSALIAVQKSLSTEQGEKQEIIQKCDQMQRERDSAMKRCKEMQSRLDEIEQEMKGLKDSNALSRDREEQAKKKTSALTRDVEQITGQNTLLKNRLESLTAAYTTAHAALHSATSSNATLQNTLTQYSSKITVLKSNILSFLTLQKEKSMSHKQRYLEEVARLTAKNQGLSKALEKSVELIKGLQSVADTKVLESSSKEGASTSKAISALIQQLRQTISQKDLQIQALQTGSALSDVNQGPAENPETLSPPTRQPELSEIDDILNLLTHHHHHHQANNSNTTGNSVTKASDLPDPKSFALDLEKGRWSVATARDELEETVRVALQTKRELQQQMQEKQERDVAELEERNNIRMKDAEAEHARRLRAAKDEEEELQRKARLEVEERIQRQQQMQQKRELERQLEHEKQLKQMEAEAILNYLPNPHYGSGRSVYSQGNPHSFFASPTNAAIRMEDPTNSSDLNSSLSEPLARLARIRHGITNLRDQVYKSNH